MYFYPTNKNGICRELTADVLEQKGPGQSFATLLAPEYRIDGWLIPNESGGAKRAFRH